MKVLSFYRSYGKRWLDLVASTLLLVLFGWLVVLVALGYLLQGQLPIFFRQWRTGMNEVPFELIKFRTLRMDTGQPLHARAFGWGSLLRGTSLDELPQVWLVLRGNMSLVGPRPLPVSYLPFLRPEEHIRHSLKPGITGLAQVRGRHRIGWDAKLRWDRYYVRHHSLALDCWILVQTLRQWVRFQPDVSLSERSLPDERSAPLVL